ncbi:VRR-NUC domain-containing protein [Solibaculum mannosilyticum]|uniref:VRR-NUC domain-containing protein n=1 Tax=Solibaculum mannosilyticum TaxID=2780922 RepID=A0A7I8D1Z2_9FIRM|nr:VRR-NUC domain-containing protein [Solibaculum mannosilyticum]BCI60837.1 hypothetical protein C12CBH8_14760 [Solibaculum mannosilyticum]
MTEGQEQQAIMQWANMFQGKYPELALLHHIPNGGKRDKVTASILKREGVKPGVPDLCLPIPRGGYHGLYLELKAGNNVPTDNQLWWLERLSEQGYWAGWCVGADEAIKTIKKYLEGEK